MATASTKEREIDRSCNRDLGVIVLECWPQYKYLLLIHTALATSSSTAGVIAMEYEGPLKLFQRSVASSNAIVLG